MASVLFTLGIAVLEAAVEYPPLFKGGAQLIKDGVHLAYGNMQKRRAGPDAVELVIVVHVLEAQAAHLYRLRLGNFQYYRKKEIVRIAWFFIYILIFCLLVHFEVLTGLVNELAFLIFYSVGDRLIQGAWLDKSGVIEEKMFLGQLMSMKVVFTEEYSPESLSDEESHELTEEIIEKAEIRNN